jgi:hypothetical protein
MTYMASTLQTAKHYVKTAYGTSTTHYGSDENPPMQGCGQGNGAGPTMWVAISAILIQIICDSGFGFNLITCLSLAAVSLIGFAFVDDTDLIHMAPNASATYGKILSERHKKCCGYGKEY